MNRSEVTLWIQFVGFLFVLFGLIGGVVVLTLWLTGCKQCGPHTHSVSVQCELKFYGDGSTDMVCPNVTGWNPHGQLICSAGQWCSQIR